MNVEMLFLPVVDDVLEADVKALILLLCELGCLFALGVLDLEVLLQVVVGLARYEDKIAVAITDLYHV